MNGKKTRDMTAPNWKRTHARLMRNIAELRGYGVACEVPAGFDIPPNRRVDPTRWPAPSSPSARRVIDHVTGVRPDPEVDAIVQHLVD